METPKEIYIQEYKNKEVLLPNWSYKPLETIPEEKTHKYIRADIVEVTLEDVDYVIKNYMTPVIMPDGKILYKYKK